jgi:hypothetical protein
VTKYWRRLHNEEPHNLYPAPNIIRVIKSREMRMAGLTRMEEMRNVYNILVGKSEGTRLLGRPRSKLEDNIRMDLIEVWIHPAQDRDH